VFAIGSSVVALVAIAGVVGHSSVQLNHRLHEMERQIESQQSALQQKERELAAKEQEAASLQKDLSQSRQAIAEVTETVEISRAQTRVVGVCLERVATLTVVESEAEALVMLGSVAETCEDAVQILDKLKAEGDNGVPVALGLKQLKT
jgi:septal ring factor EnvC (AmiA/AmiB activator)